MKERQITIAKIVLVVVFIAAGLLPLWLMIFPSVRDHQLQMRLLCKTDHVALRFVGRELLREAGQEPVASNGHILHGSDCVPVSQSPKVIRRLSPRGIRMEEDRLYIDFGGQTHNFGVIIYPTDFNEPYPEYRGGDRKLVEGMWYYDVEYYTDPTYDEWIGDKLRKNRTMRHRAHRRLRMFQTDREVLEFLALMVQVWGLMATVALTFMFRRKKWAPDIGLGLGFLVNVVGQIGLAGGGPGACVGFFVFPLLGWLVSLLTLKVAAWFC